MPKATVGVRRAFARLRPTRIDRGPSSIRFHRRSIQAARELRARAATLAATAQANPGAVARAATAPVRRSAVGRLVPGAGTPLVVAVIVMFAAIASWLPGMPALGAVGGTTSEPTEPRITIGGARSEGAGAAPVLAAPLRMDDLVAPETSAADARTAEPEPAEPEPAEEPASRAADRAAAAQPAADPAAGRPDLDLRRADPDAAELVAADGGAGADGAPVEAAISGPFLPDGTLLKPIAVTTTLADGRGLLRRHKVVAGETLSKIADKYDLAKMTVWWANDFKSEEDLKVGQSLVIPPVNGLVVTVKEGDSLEALAKAHDVAADKIYKTNGLEDRVLIAGQTLVLPGAKGVMPAPEAPPAAKRGGGGAVRTPATYAGGAMAWPVVGGDNSISRGFRSGHYGLDIAADYGSRVRAGAGGTVTYAGWKSNGGGYQVWIAHGSGLYTTYNHLSGVSVGVGQRVGKGQQVGRIGSSGWATGPHLHFEVWRGPIWDGGTRVNPLAYL